jgi:SAM-dependent methyltransferase
MHPSIQHWVGTVREQHPAHFADGCRVMEYGSRNINGTVRRWFSNPSEYVGIDAYAGPDVDVVGVVHEYEPEQTGFDVVITTEMLEHDPYWKDTLNHAIRHLREGGILMITCAAPKRAPHHHEDSPTPGYYGNRSVEDIRTHLEANADWAHLDVHLRRNDLDLHAYGVKA